MPEGRDKEKGRGRVRIDRVYTRTGDQGDTGLAGGGRVSKASARIEALGEVDELNATLALARSQLLGEKAVDPEISTVLRFLMNQLFDLGASLARPRGESESGPGDLLEGDVERVETWLDRWSSDLPPLESFVLPGGSEPTAALHLARAVCRRAERSLVRLREAEPLPPQALAYLNRLSDLLFVLARAVARDRGEEELLWEPR